MLNPAAKPGCSVTPLETAVPDRRGTLAESKSSLDAEMAALIGRLLETVKAAIISGGAWQQFEKQVLANLPGGGPPTGSGVPVNAQAGLTQPFCSLEGSHVMEDFSGIKNKLSALGAKIAAKTDELDRQGVMHGAARAKAVELRVAHLRLSTLAEERAKGSTHAESAAVLAAEAETLRLSFDTWLAEIDKGY